MKKIKLTQEQFALVDDADFERLSGSKWYALKTGYGGFCAARGRKPTILMHRVIMDAPKGVDVDHINHNTLDNRRDNLRLATRSENNRNQRPRLGCSSKYKGVSLENGRWVASIELNYRRRLGSFDLEVDAAKAYDKAARALFGKFAYPNFENGDSL